MLIKSPNSANTYRPIPLADSLLKNGEVVEGEWQRTKVTDFFYQYNFLEVCTIPQPQLNLLKRVLKITL